MGDVHDVKVQDLYRIYWPYKDLHWIPLLDIYIQALYSQPSLFELTEGYLKWYSNDDAICECGYVWNNFDY